MNKELAESGSVLITSPEEEEGGGTDPEEKLKEALKRLEAYAASYKAEMASMYTSGQINRQEYDAFLEEGDRDLIEKKMQLYAAGSKEYNQFLAQLREMDVKHYEGCLKETVDQIDQMSKEEKRILADDYAEKRITKEAYEEGIFRLDYEALQRKRDLYEKDSREFQDYQLQLDELTAQDQIKRREKYEQLILSIQKRYRKDSLKELKEQELKDLDLLLENKEMKQEDYEKLKLAIQRKYALMGLKANKEITGTEEETSFESEGEGDGFFNQLFKQEQDRRRMQMAHLEDLWEQGLITEEEYLQRRKEINLGYYESIMEKAEAAYAQINAVVQSYSQYSQASQELEESKIRKKYDAEIKAAGNNSKKVTKLEEEKEAALAKVKSEYADKQFGIQIAQGLAQTAMSAINAYNSAAAIPIVGHILAPMAAAAATAAGLLQVGAIKKQKEAAKNGYAQGGFTPSGRWDEEQGVVHSGEFIANRFAVGNPEIRPVLNLIDQAQKNNTVGNLRAADVSRVLGNNNPVPALSSAGTVAGNTPGSTIPPEMLLVMGEINRTMRDLQERLKDPIESYVTLDGVKGFDSQWKRYQKLQSNKNR